MGEPEKFFFYDLLIEVKLYEATTSPFIWVSLECSSLICSDSSNNKHVKIV